MMPVARLDPALVPKKKFSRSYDGARSRLVWDLNLKLQDFLISSESGWCVQEVITVFVINKLPGFANDPG